MDADKKRLWVSGQFIEVTDEVYDAYMKGDRRVLMDNENEKSKSKVPIWQKSNLTIEEAAEYSGIGRNKLRQLSDNEKCPFVLWVGNKRLIKRRELDEYTGRMYSI